MKIYVIGTDKCWLAKVASLESSFDIKILNCLPTDDSCTGSLPIPMDNDVLLVEDDLLEKIVPIIQKIHQIGWKNTILVSAGYANHAAYKLLRSGAILDIWKKSYNLDDIKHDLNLCCAP